MKLPNPDRAIVDIAKLEACCLNPFHPDGGHKALVFAALGFTEREANRLQTILLDVVREDAEHVKTDEFGARYAIDFELLTRSRSIRVRSGWIVRKLEDFPRLTTCYVLK